MNFKMSHILRLLLMVIASVAVVDGKRFYVTRWGHCTDCDFRSSNYQWCNLGRGLTDWDYCSTTPGMSSRNKQCREDHECDFHGEKYFWCYLKEGGWDYCSLIEDTSIVQYTTYSEPCQNYCDLESEKYMCRKRNKDYEECSIVENVAAHGSGCKIDGGGTNQCGKHGNNYNWCYTNDGSWGYCSDLKTDTSVLYTEGRQKRQGEASCSSSVNQMVQLHNIVQRLSNNVRLVTTIYREEPNRANLVLATGRLRDDAQTVIYRWHEELSSDSPVRGSTTEQRYGRIRLDIQGITNTANFGQFMNWQLQINGNHPRPTTVAHVNIPQFLQGFQDGDNTNRGWRRMLATGLHHSLNTGATVWIVQQKVDRYGNLQCPRRSSHNKRETLIEHLLFFI